VLKLLPLLLACAHSTSTGDAGAVVVLAPGVEDRMATVPAPPGDVPGSLGPALPALAGQTEVRVAEGRALDIQSFTLGADLSPLARIDTGEAGMLAAHLAAHPRFRLTRWQGATIAWLRRSDQQLGRTVGWGGFHEPVTAGGAGTWRAGLRIRPRAPSMPWTDSRLVDRFTPDDSVLSVHAWKPDDAAHPDRRAAAIEVRAKELTLEVIEQSDRLELVATSAAIKEVARDLLDLDRFHGDADLQQRPWGWLPPGEPTHDPRGLYVTETDAGVDIRGRLNPGAPGWTWARITDAAGRPWLESLTAAATLERIGWSDDDALSFWFQGRVPTDMPVPAGAIVEAWFSADDGGAAQPVGRWSVP